MWWYRTFVSLGKFSVVGTTIRNCEQLPADLHADEYHTKVKGEKHYVATTLSQGCILGSTVCESASEEALLEGYQIYKEEATNLPWIIHRAYECIEFSIFKLRSIFLSVIKPIFSILCCDNCLELG